MEESYPNVVPGERTCVPRRCESRANLSSGNTITDEERGDVGHPLESMVLSRRAQCLPPSHSQVFRPSREGAGTDVQPALFTGVEAEAKLDGLLPSTQR